MKLFSRKALVAGATAVAVAFAGTSVATAEATTTGSSDSISQLSSGENAGEGLSSDLPALASLSSKDKEDEDDLSSKPDEIASWISVFTAIVGALAAAVSFATKYLGFKI